MKILVLFFSFFLLSAHGCENHAGSDNPVQNFWMGEREILVMSTSSEANSCAQSVSEGAPKCNGEVIVILNLEDSDVPLVFSSAGGSEENILIPKGEEMILEILSTWVAVRVEG